MFNRMTLRMATKWPKEWKMPKTDTKNENKMTKMTLRMTTKWIKEWLQND